jgi:hypothetical protein
VNVAIAYVLCVVHTLDVHAVERKPIPANAITIR